jgi:enediyne biosynthesis protein E4
LPAVDSNAYQRLAIGNAEADLDLSRRLVIGCQLVRRYEAAAGRDKFIVNARETRGCSEDSNVEHEMYSLYHNIGNATFEDVAVHTLIGPATRMMSGWGLRFFDFDNDGELDLLIANGHPDLTIQSHHPDLEYLQASLLFRGNGGVWTNVSEQAGPAFKKKIAGRGLALGGFDNNGAVDALITVNNGPPVLLRNQAAGRNHWLGLKLIGTKSNIDAVGARITYQSGDLKRSRTKVGGGSYLSSHDPRIVLGLGPRSAIDWVEIRWPKPGGSTTRFSGLPVDRYITVTEGQSGWR